MAAYKLKRGENFRWADPCLEFDIERHGGLAVGSTRAELQHWVVDLQALTAHCEPAGKRQISPMREAMTAKDMECVAVELRELVVARADDPRLKWVEGRDRVRVLSGVIINPTGDVPKQTLDGPRGRRRRLGDAVSTEFARIGWRDCGSGWYERERRT
jgi:hypothetical protein